MPSWAEYIAQSTPSIHLFGRRSPRKQKALCTAAFENPAGTECPCTRLWHIPGFSV